MPRRASRRRDVELEVPSSVLGTSLPVDEQRATYTGAERQQDDEPAMSFAP